MKKTIIIICLLGLFLTAAVTSLKWRQISDATPTITEINFVDGVTAPIQQQLNDKPNISDGFQLTDTFPRRTEVEANLSLKADKTFTDQIEFIVGYSGGATLKNGDSILTDSRWIGKDMVIYKNGLRIYKNLTATNGKVGFRFNSTTGQIVFRPVLATNDVVIVDSKTTTFTQSYLPQNFVRYSENLTISTEYWNPSSGTLSDTNAGIDMTGAYTLEKFTGTAADSRFLYFNDSNGLVTTGGTSYILSFDCDNETLPNLVARIYDVTHSATIVDVNYAAQVTGGNTTRVSIPFTTPVGCIKVYLYIVYSGGVGAAWLGRINVSSNGFGANYVLTTTNQIN